MTTKTYTAVKPIGRFLPGDIVAGLTDKQLTTALQDGVIKEAVPSKAPAATLKENKLTKEPTNG